MTKKGTDPFGAPLVRLMDGRTVVAVFVYSHGRWREHGKLSKAELRRHEKLLRLPDEQREARATGRNGPSGVHRVQLIGDTPFAQAYRREWDGLCLQEIPGYREVYDFGRGRAFRAERLLPALDAIRDAGRSQVQLDVLDRVIEHMSDDRHQSC